MTCPSRAPIVVHVRVADFLVEAERFGAPALVGRPVVIGGAADSPGRVVAASAEARARGVAPGQPLRGAARLCPQARFLPGDLERQHDLRALVDEAIRRRVARLAWVAIDEAVLDLGPDGPASARRAAEDIQLSVRRDLGVSVAMGIAATPLAARVAARMAMPRGLVAVLPGYDARFLAALPLDDFDPIDPRGLARLRAEGLATVGDLARLPTERALALLGMGGATIVALARGECGRLPDMTPTPRRICRQRALAPTDRLDEALRCLAAEVSACLRRAGCAATTLGLRLEYAGGASRAHATPLAEPSADAEVLWRSAKRLLAHFVSLASVGRLLSLSATGLLALPAQGELFDARPSPDGPRPSRQHAGGVSDGRRLAG